MDDQGRSWISIFGLLIAFHTVKWTLRPTIVMFNSWLTLTTPLVCPFQGFKAWLFSHYVKFSNICKRFSSSNRVNNKTIDIVFSRCDLDGNGKLDYQEFKAMIFRSKERKEAAQREVDKEAQKRKLKTLKKENKIKKESKSRKTKKH